MRGLGNERLDPRCAGIKGRALFRSRRRAGRTYKAYIDHIREKTGHGPEYFLAEAQKRGLTQHSELLNWLKGDGGLGHGHANAIILYIREPALAKRKIAADAKREK